MTNTDAEIFAAIELGLDDGSLTVFTPPVELRIVANRMRRVTSIDVNPYGDWCGVCGRATDHFGEHDDLVDLGLARNQKREQVFTNGDGRTVHVNQEWSVVPTEEFHTDRGEAARTLLHQAWDAQNADWMAGRVSLVKPVGYVLTALAEVTV